jgi:hypothetical protein
VPDVQPVGADIVGNAEDRRVRVDAPANARVRLDHRDIEPRLDQSPRRRHAGGTGADDNHVGLGSPREARPQRCRGESRAKLQ